MKTLKATFKNGTFETSRTFEIENKAKENVYFGTLLRWMFRASEVYRQVSKGAPKATELNEIKLECDGFKFDTNTIEAGLKDKFKFGRTAKSKGNFAKNLWTVYKFVTEDQPTDVVGNVISELDEVVASEAIAN
jgi:hypothetical protein